MAKGPFQTKGLHSCPPVQGLVIKEVRGAPRGLVGWGK